MFCFIVGTRKSFASRQVADRAHFTSALPLFIAFQNLNLGDHVTVPVAFIMM